MILAFEGIELITSHEDGSVRVWKSAAYPGTSSGDGSTRQDSSGAPSSSWVEFAVIETDAPVMYVPFLVFVSSLVIIPIFLSVLLTFQMFQGPDK